MFFQAIHEKIKSLDLNQCHAKIKQVDSHSTLGNGIVIQVGYVAACTWCKIHSGLSLTLLSLSLSLSDWYKISDSAVLCISWYWSSMLKVHLYAHIIL